MRSSDYKIGITQGDTNGVGWEVILKIFAEPSIYELCTPIVYGNLMAAKHYTSLLEEGGSIQFNTITNPKEARPKRLNIIECGDKELEIKAGEATKEAAKAAISALDRASKDLESRAIDGVVTAPINKDSITQAGFKFKGHTEYFESTNKGDALMFMCSDSLRVALATKHIPVNEISKSLTKEGIIFAITNLRRSLTKDFEIPSPRIAVLALNPHAGDGGVIGKEEAEIIAPAIKSAYLAGTMVFGAFAADGFFASGAYKKYDAILAMYHDQGLIPFKTLSPEGVNFTAGLDVIRTSPDHGTAYDIAGKGEADPSSMRNAIYLALDTIRSRERFFKINENPLQRAPRERSSGRDISVKDMPQFRNETK